MSYSLGKKLTLIGFGGAALFRFIQLVFSLIFPEGYDELLSYYKVGEIITISAVAAEGYAPLRVEYSYGGETYIAIPS